MGLLLVISIVLKRSRAAISYQQRHLRDKESGCLEKHTVKDYVADEDFDKSLILEDRMGGLKKLDGMEIVHRKLPEEKYNTRMIDRWFNFLEINYYVNKE